MGRNRHNAALALARLMGANAPAPRDADRTLDRRMDEVVPIPGILCNAGGTEVSYFGWERAGK